nr:ribonuclease H-like domain-containing protein [Tanacetum cinerariifolium]
MKYQPKVAKPKKVGTLERLSTPKPRKSRLLFKWSPTGRLFNQEGKLVDSSESKRKSDYGDNACTSNTMEPKIKRFPNSTSLLNRNDYVAAIMGFGDLRWGNILITRVYFVEGLGHNLFSVGQFCDSDLEAHFLRSKDEAPEVIIKFLKRITVLLQSPVIIIRTDNSTEFKNQVLKEYLDTVGISNQMSSVRTPQQNGVVERRNRTLVEAAKTMLIFSHSPLFLWAEAIVTTSKPGLNSMTSGHISSGLDLTYAPSTITTQQPSEGELDLLFEAMYDDYIGGQLKTDDRIDKLADQILNLVEIVNKQVIAPAKAVEKTCVTCGGAHAYYDCIATDSNQPSVYAATGSYNQVSLPNLASHQIPPPGFAPVQNNPNRINHNQGQGNYFKHANNFNQENNFRGKNFQNNQGYRAQMNNASNFENQ